MKTYKDFKTRTDFIKYLDLYKPGTNPDFVEIDQIDPIKYTSELEQILKNIDVIKNTWNNQSVHAIEQSVAKSGQKQLDIMQGQKTEKLHAGYKSNQAMFRVSNCNGDSYFQEFAQHIGLQNSLARYHVQFPGEVTAWHTDIFSPSHEFLQLSTDKAGNEIDDNDVGKDKNIRRIIIALQDWDWGHFLVFGHSPWQNWRAGQVIYWEYGVPHGSANMGYTPRISVSITGQASAKFVERYKNATKQ